MSQSKDGVVFIADNQLIVQENSMQDCRASISH